MAKANISHNPRLRVVAKLLLNSLWGQFRELNNQTEYMYVMDATKLFANNMTKNICLVHEINVSFLRVEFKS